jgi:hypothetical protein
MQLFKCSKILTSARRRGTAVAFNVPTSRSRVEIIWYLGSRRRTKRIPKRTVILNQRLLNASAGLHSFGLRMSSAIAKRIRRSGQHRTAIRVQVRAPRRRTITTFQLLRLRY